MEKVSVSAFVVLIVDADIAASVAGQPVPRAKIHLIQYCKNKCRLLANTYLHAFFITYSLNSYTDIFQYH